MGTLRTVHCRAFASVYLKVVAYNCGQRISPCALHCTGMLKFLLLVMETGTKLVCISIVLTSHPACLFKVIDLKRIESTDHIATSIFKKVSNGNPSLYFHDVFFK